MRPASSVLERHVRGWCTLALSLILISSVGPLAMADPGSLDPSFGHDGIVHTSFVHAFDQYPTSVAVQRDGKVLVAGLAKLVGPTQVFALARYRKNGELDGSFNGDGRVTSSAGVLAYDVVVQPNGKIVEGGFAKGGGFGLVRYRPDGSLNGSFGDHGHVVTDVCGPHCVNGIDALAIDSRARIVAAGESEDGLALARYLPDGSLDDGFGHHGVVTMDMGGMIFGATDVAIAPRGNIVVVGTTLDSDFALARFTTDGTLDGTFAGGGFVTTDFSGGSEDDAWALAIRRRGKLVVAGTSICSSCSKGEFAVARYLPSGLPDTAFAGDGTVTTSVGKGSDHAFGVLAQRHGRIVVAGGSACHFALARFLGDATLDPSFGTGGTVRTYLGSGCAVANDVAQEGLNKVVVAGPAGSLFAAARYQAS